MKVRVISLIFFILLVALSFPLFGYGTLVEEYAGAEKAYQECLDSLPANVKWGLTTSSARGRRNWGRAVKKKVDVCLSRERLKNDYSDTIHMGRDLKDLYKGHRGPVDKTRMEDEANKISSILVKTTSALNERFKMANVALWHNFLIKLGAKEGGYCYQWVENLLNTLPWEKFKYFERHWGVHNQAMVTENNAVIITRRGRPISEGIVYDPWRGKGRPFWRAVAEDTQTWKELFSEDQVLGGQM